MNPKETGEFIQKLRKEKKMTQQQLADMLKVTNKAVSKWETGKGYPDIDSMLGLSRVFDVSINELLSAKRIHSDRGERDAQKTVATEFLNTEKKRKRSKWLSIGLAALIALGIVIRVFNFAMNFTNFQHRYTPDQECQISEDYSTMTIYGNEYVKIYPTDDDPFVDVWCSEVLFDRPIIGNSVSRFVNRVYSVKYCDNYDIVYLDADTLVNSGIFCKAEKVKLYEDYLKKDVPGAYYMNVDYGLSFGDPKEPTELSEDFTKTIARLDELKRVAIEHDSNDYRFSNLCVRGERSPLIKRFAAIVRENGNYYLDMNDDDDPYDGTNVYLLPEKLYGELSEAMAQENY